VGAAVAGALALLYFTAGVLLARLNFLPTLVIDSADGIGFAALCWMVFAVGVIIGSQKDVWHKENEFGCSGEQPSSLIPTRPKFFGTAEPCPSEKTICYSPLAIRYSLPFYQSLIAIRRRFGSAGASPSHF
jgi:hypothetical protein